MVRMIYAARGWKKLQKEYLLGDLLSLRRKKLDELLLRDLSGSSYEEAVMHYSALSFLAAQCAVAGYMQTGGLEQAECWFCLSAEARRTANALLPRDPRWKPARAAEPPVDTLTIALLCGDLPAALDCLHAVQTALDREEAPAQHGGRPLSRADQRLEQRRRQRLSLACGLYEGLLRNDDPQARQALQALDALPWDPLLSRALHALLSGDAGGLAHALAQHTRDFRTTPDPGELNYALLLLEALWKRRGGEPPLDLAEAPRALLELPPCDPSRLAEALGLPLPSFDAEAVLRRVDPDKIGPKFMSL